MATNHITDEQALDETLVNLVRLAGLAGAEPLFQLEIGILQGVHCARKISNQMCQMCGKYIYIQYITLDVYIYYVHMLLYSRDDDHPEL